MSVSLSVAAVAKPPETAAAPQPQPLPPPLVAAKVAKVAKGLSLPWSPSALELAGVWPSLKKPCSHRALASAALIGLAPGQGFLEAPKDVQRAVFQQALSRNTLSGSSGAGRLAIGPSRGAGSAESARVLDQLSRVPLPPKDTDGLDLSTACAYLRQVCPRACPREQERASQSSGNLARDAGVNDVGKSGGDSSQRQSSYDQAQADADQDQDQDQDDDDDYDSGDFDDGDSDFA